MEKLEAAVLSRCYSKQASLGKFPLDAFQSNSATFSHISSRKYLSSYLELPSHLWNSRPTSRLVEFHIWTILLVPSWFRAKEWRLTAQEALRSSPFWWMLSRRWKIASIPSCLLSSGTSRLRETIRNLWILLKVQKSANPSQLSRAIKLMGPSYYSLCPILLT